MQDQASQGAEARDLESGDLVKKEPDAFVGAYTVALAEGMLTQAVGAFNAGDFDTALDQARNALRIAASGVLFRDGYIARTLEASCDYLDKNYPGVFPTAAWKEAEEFPTTSERHIGHAILETVGLSRSRQYEEKDYARKAMHVAEDFIHAAKDLIAGIDDRGGGLEGIAESVEAEGAPEGEGAAEGEGPEEAEEEPPEDQGVAG